MVKVKITCKQCGVVCIKNLVVRSKIVPKYCSHSCSMEGQRRRETRSCKVCGTEFETLISDRKLSCSKPCSEQQRRNTIEAKKTCPT